MAKRKSKRKKKAKEEIILSKEEYEQNKQLAWILGIIILFFGVFLASYFYFQNQNYFNYAGLDFRKEKIGEINFYHAQFPIIYQGQVYRIHNLYLRTDPRKNKIPVNTNFSISERVIISLDEEIKNCDKAVLGQTNLAMFLWAMPWVKNVTAALTDREAAERNNMDFADCSNASNRRTIILVKKADKNSIEMESENCYRLNVANCEYLKVAERYIMAVVEQINQKENKN
ncbi:MAG: hypothetical protein QXX68_00140 [Candidatus Pacearchaeota archaeon]